MGDVEHALDEAEAVAARDEQPRQATLEELGPIDPDLQFLQLLAGRRMPVERVVVAGNNGSYAA